MNIHLSQPCAANEDTAATYIAINKQVLIGVENDIGLKRKPHV